MNGAMAKNRNIMKYHDMEAARSFSPILSPRRLGMLTSVAPFTLKEGQPPKVPNFENT